MAIRKHITCTRASEIESACENVWVKMTQPNGKHLYLCAFYRPHVSDDTSTMELRKSLEQVPSTATIVIAGDLNVPDINWDSKLVHPGSCHANTQNEFLELLEDFNIDQMVTEPTRQDNILDLVLLNHPRLCSGVEITAGISDHEAVTCELDFRPRKKRLPAREISMYHKADWSSLGNHMQQCHNFIVENKEIMDANQLWNTFSDRLKDGIAKHVPTKKARTGNDKPWVTTKLRRLIKKRDRLFTRQKRNTNREVKEQYKEVKKVVQKEMRKAYWDYMESIVTPTTEAENAKCSKKFWSYIKRCGEDSSDIAQLSNNKGEIVRDATEKAEVLNTQFQSVFTPPSPPSLSSLCEGFMSPTDIPSMPRIEITTAGVDKLLTELKIHKAAGPDNIKPIVLKNLHLVIAPTLQVIFEKAYTTQQTPEEWRKAYVTPIYKKGKREDPANYRPVSLTCVVSKLMEHIIVSSLMRHMEGNSLIHDNQHGFRQRRSCETQLIDFIHKLSSSMHDGTQTDIVVMDFAKAFDTVPHTHLLLKLRRLGVDPTTTGWISSFLKGRRQRVVLDGVMSSEVPVVSGVPQGSVLGPILFLAYINDLPHGLSSDIRLFADDTVICREIKSDADGVALQEDLERLEAWSRKWLLKFHPNKCQVLRVTRARRSFVRPYKLFGADLQETTSIKYLGITISSDLRWNQQIDNARAKANKKLGFLRRNVRIGSTQLKSQLYSTVVRSGLEYGSTIWSPHEAKLINSLESVQRRAARWAVARYRRTDSVSRMLEELGWKTLEQRRFHDRLIMMFKIIHGLAYVPHNFLSQPSHTRHSRNTNKHTYALFHTRTNYFKYSFFPYTVSQWNALPVDILDAPTVEAFKARLQQAAATRTF